MVFNLVYFIKTGAVSGHIKGTPNNPLYVNNDGGRLFIFIIFIFSFLPPSLPPSLLSFPPFIHFFLSLRPNEKLPWITAGVGEGGGIEQKGKSTHGPGQQCGDR